MATTRPEIDTETETRRLSLQQVLLPQAEITWEPRPQLHVHGRTVDLKVTSDRVRTALEALGHGSDVDLAAAQSGVTQDLASALPWSMVLRTLDAVGALLHRLPSEDGVPIAELVAINRGPVQPPPRTRDLGGWVPDPTASARVEGGRLTLQVPTSRSQVHLGPAAAAAWAEIAAGQVPSAPWWPELARLLAAAGALREEPVSPEERLWSLAEWSAYVHARRPDTVAGFAGTYRGAQSVPVPPAHWEPGSTAAVVDLVRPDPDRLARTDPPLAAVSESRRSRREHDGARPITLEQVGELLHRVARVRGVLRSESGEAVDRPVPAGGSLHEIEVFVASQQCTGLEPGLWWYDAHEHRLVHVAEPGRALERLVGYAASATLQSQPPQVLLQFAARPARLLTKYETIGYALMEKHTGVLMHAVYLAAEAMGLATCAVGAGDGSAFAAVTGRGPAELAPLGEMTLGSRLPDGAAGADSGGGR